MTRPMKDSGVEWISEIPESWNIVRNKNVFSCSKEIVGTAFETTQLLSLTTKGVREKDINDTNGKIPESYDTYQIVKPNQIVMCLFDLDCSAVFSGISKYFGMISPAYDIITCKSIAFPSYYNYWFSFVSENRKFKHYAKNLRYTLNYNEFSRLPVVIPSRLEQQKIASFLDEKCSAIDEIIAMTEQSIEEYKKLKQSVITEAVTKGIRPNRKMKDSGFEWIGEIPENYSLISLKYVAENNKETLPETTDPLYEFDYIDIGSVTYGKGIENVQTMKFKDAPSRARRVVYKDDVILSTVRTYLKATAQIMERSNPVIVSTGFITLTAIKNKISPAYLKYAIQLDAFISEVESKSEGISYPAINSTEVVMIKVILPPLSEQKEIADYLDKKCAEIDVLIGKKQQFLTELATYKKSLIYEYVTGKKEVV